jgi:hypothetical protein
LAVPTVLYGNECWILSKEQLQQNELSEMRFLRSVAGYKKYIKKKKYRYQAKLKNIQSMRENKGIPAELLQTYLKNANILNPSQDIQLQPLRKNS